MPRENEAEFVSWALKGDRGAIDFCDMFFRISQTWDDLIDRDKPIHESTINRMMWDALIELPSNSFYLEHQAELIPLFRQYAIDWMDSNVLERGKSDHGKNIAFVLRDSVSSLLTQCAYYIGGIEWMAEVSVHIREHIFEDTLFDYKASLENQQ